MLLHQANFLYLAHLVYLLSNILHILLHLYVYKLHIHELYHQAILLHKYLHQHELIFLLYLLYLQSNILHIYCHLSILVFLFHVFYFHFFPIHQNKSHDFHIQHFVLIQREHRLLMEEIFGKYLLFLLLIKENLVLEQNEYLIHLEINYFFLLLLIVEEFFLLEEIP